MPIYSLFPEPIYFSKLERSLTKEELKMVNKYKKKTSKNVGGNTFTYDNQILEHKTLKHLKKDLYKMIMDYFNKIVCPPNPLIPYISQSWFNYTQPGERHHNHAHPNSYISGVLYIAANKEVDRIKFHKTGYERIRLEATQFNMYNSRSWWYPVGTADVVLFPSYLVHGVDTAQGPNTRTSLSFNVFIKGNLGSKKEITELIIE